MKIYCCLLYNASAALLQVRSDWHKKWQQPDFASLRPFPGVGLEALKLLHLKRDILFHGERPAVQTFDKLRTADQLLTIL
jgi:kynurenine formamidase